MRPGFIARALSEEQIAAPATAVPQRGSEAHFPDAIASTSGRGEGVLRVRCSAVSKGKVSCAVTISLAYGRSHGK